MKSHDFATEGLTLCSDSHFFRRPPGAAQGMGRMCVSSLRGGRANLTCILLVLVCVRCRSEQRSGSFTHKNERAPRHRARAPGVSEGAAPTWTQRGSELRLNLGTNPKVMSGWKMSRRRRLPAAELHGTRRLLPRRGVPCLPTVRAPVSGSGVGQFCPLELTRSGVMLEVRSGVSNGWLWAGLAELSACSQPLLPLLPTPALPFWVILSKR